VQDAGGVGAVPSVEAVEAVLMVPKVDDAGLSGRWGHQHTAPIPEGLAGLGARGQGPVAPGPTLAEVQADRDYERRRANEAIAQLHDAQRELAALRAILPTPGKGERMTWEAYTAHVLQSLPADGPGRDPLVLFARLVGELGELADATTSPGRILEAGDVLFFVAALERVLMLDLGGFGAVYATIDTLPHAFANAARIGQMLAKYAENGEPVDMRRVRAWLYEVRHWTFSAVASTTPAEVMAANVRKLDAKWGRG